MMGNRNISVTLFVYPACANSTREEDTFVSHLSDKACEKKVMLSRDFVIKQKAHY